MNLGIDLDGCCFDFVGRFISYINVRYRLKSRSEQIVLWDWWKIPEMQMTKEMWLKAFEEFSKYRMWQSIPIFPDVTDVLCSLAEESCNIYYLTDRPKDARRATMKALLSNGLPVDSIIFCSGTQKAEIVKTLNISVALDDKPETIGRYSEIDTVIPVLMERPYNKDVVFSPRVKKCSDIKGFKDLITQLLADK